jgi:hypothetical protein
MRSTPLKRRARNPRGTDAGTPVVRQRTRARAGECEQRGTTAQSAGLAAPGVWRAGARLAHPRGTECTGARTAPSSHHSGILTGEAHVGDRSHSRGACRRLLLRAAAHVSCPCTSPAPAAGHWPPAARTGLLVLLRDALLLLLGPRLRVIAPLLCLACHAELGAAWLWVGDGFSRIVSIPKDLLPPPEGLAAVGAFADAFAAAHATVQCSVSNF